MASKDRILGEMRLGPTRSRFWSPAIGTRIVNSCCHLLFQVDEVTCILSGQIARNLPLLSEKVDTVKLAFPVLLPEQEQGHPLAFQFPLDRRPVRMAACRCRKRRRGREQQPLHGPIVQLGGQQPGKSCISRPAQVLIDRRARDAAAPGCSGHGPSTGVKPLLSFAWTTSVQASAPPFYRPKRAQDTAGYPRQSLGRLTPSGGGRLHRDQWQLWNGMSGSFAVESVAGLDRSSQDLNISRSQVPSAKSCKPNFSTTLYRLS